MTRWLRPHRQAYDHLGSFAGSVAVRLDAAAVQLHNAAHEREADSQAAVVRSMDRST